MSNSSVSREEREYLRHLRDVHFREQSGRCYFCDVAMTPADVPEPKPDTTVTIEHLKGRASGGGSNYLNTAASCLACNNKRSAQRQVGKRTVPKVRIAPPQRVYTYVYTIRDEPDTLVLMNTTQGRQVALMDIRKAEQQPFTLLHVGELKEPS